eukprot:7133163-Prymnesium_polylepis.1
MQRVRGSVRALGRSKLQRGSGCSLRATCAKKRVCDVARCVGGHDPDLGAPYTRDSPPMRHGMHGPREPRGCLDFKCRAQHVAVFTPNCQCSLDHSPPRPGRVGKARVGA